MNRRILAPIFVLALAFLDSGVAQQIPSQTITVPRSLRLHLSLTAPDPCVEATTVDRNRLRNDVLRSALLARYTVVPVGAGEVTMQTCIRMAILAFMLMVLIISSAAQTANKAGPSPAYRCACEGPYQAYDLEHKAQRLVNQAQAIPDLQVPAYERWTSR